MVSFDSFDELFDSDNDESSTEEESYDETDNEQELDEEEILELDEPVTIADLRDRKPKKVVYDSALFTLEGFSADQKVRFAHCDHRGGRRKNTKDVDCCCRLWIEVSTGIILKVAEDHSHEVEPWKVSYYKLKLDQNKAQDRDLTRASGEIVRESLRNVDETTKMLLPSNSTQRSRLTMRKAKKLNLPPEPIDMNFDLPERLQYARYGKPDQIKILLADSRQMYPGEDLDKRIIMFYHPAVAEFIHLIKHAHVDGTFSIVPNIRRQHGDNSRRRNLPENLEEAVEEFNQEPGEQRHRRVRNPFIKKFSQVYVILGERKGTNESKFVTPLLHVLMIQSDSAAYEKMWAMIRVKLPSFNPNSFSGDYELAAINAVLTTYSYNNIQFFGCAFHFRYSMDQQANKKRVSKILKKPVPYVKKRLMFALAYVRIDKVEEYAKVVAALITEPELLEYKKSFFKTWIGNSTLGKRPRYKHEWWNLFERIKSGNSTTNNYSESDNACLSKLMGVKKPGVWRFMLRLEAVYDHYEARYHEFLAPHVIRKKSTYEETRARVIKQTVDRFENLTAKEYLYAIVKATTTSGS